ncbi:MAG: ABC transporter permease [Mycoplasmataceae bacterium]|nr:ABC transporter permease [Mycoplasmataceae bacterium]
MTETRSRFQPFLAMLSFLTRTFFKNKSVYISYVICTIVVLISCLLPGWLNLEETMTRFLLTLPIITIFLSIWIQSSAQTVFIFIDTQNEGLEILLLSKPIKRYHVFWSRTLFLFAFGLVISLLNLIFLYIGLIQIQSILTEKEILNIIGGAFGGQILLFLIVFSLTLLISMLISGKAGRVLPNIIFSFSYVLTSIIPTFSALDTKNINPLEKINMNFVNYLNASENNLDNFKEGLKKEDANPSFNSVIDEIQYVDYKDLTEAKDNYNQVETPYIFSVVNSNTLVFNHIYLYKVKPQYNDKNELTNGDELKTIEINKDGNGDYLIIDKEKFAKTIFDSLYESLKGKTIKGNNALIVFNYINPLSALTSMTGFNLSFSMSTFINQITLDEYSNYNEIGVIKNSSEHFKESNGVYYTNFNTIKMNPAWALGTMWSILAILLIGLSYYTYERRDFK